jgi:hypothetical protein
VQCGVRASDRADTHGVGHSLDLAASYGNADPDSDGNTDPDSDGNADSDSDANADPDADPHPDSNSDPHPDADGHPNPDADGHPNPDADGHPDPNCHPVRERDLRGARIERVRDTDLGLVVAGAPAAGSTHRHPVVASGQGARAAVD